MERYCSKSDNQGDQQSTLRPEWMTYYVCYRQNEEPVVAARTKNNSVHPNVNAPNAGNAGDRPAASFTPGKAKYSAEGMVISISDAVTVLYLHQMI